MNANELRIGNNVLDKHGNIIKITGITDITLFSDEHYKSGQLIEWCEEIKLNEKIISEICGELNELSGDYRIQVTDDYSMSFAMDNDMISIGDDIEIIISETPLHRLQNLYLDLAGRELTVP